MADYECFPLWDLGPSGPANIDPAALPISPELQAKLYEWSARYDQTLDRTDPLSSGFATSEGAAEFAEDGRTLALHLAKELGSSWSVVYFNNETGESQLVQ